MSRISVQVASPEIHGTTLPGPAPVLVEGAQKWANPAESRRNSARPATVRRFALGHRRSWTLAVAAVLLTSAGAQAQAVFGTPQPVGTAAGDQNVTVTAQAAGTVANVEVLTLGVTGLDFTKGIGALNCDKATLAAGATCTESIEFTPAAPGLRIGAVVLLDSNNNVLGTAYLSGTGLGGLGVLVPGNVLTVAGDGIYKGSVLDGSPAPAASLYLPTSVTLDGAGNLYIADSLHNRIRKVTASTGIISTLAGNGNPTYTGDGLPSTNPAVTLNSPSGVALDGAGNLYIADSGNNVVRRITASTGIISTVAGTGAIGNGGDGAAAKLAELNQPQGVTVDASGDFYIADTSNHRIRRVDAVSGIITTVAGNGTMNPVTGDGGYSGDNGPATQAELNFPYAVAFDGAGNMYIPDSRNNVVRKVTAVNGILTGSDTIGTFAGTGAPAFSGDSAAASLAELWSPEGVIADPAGNVYIADTQNAAIRKVSSGTGNISTVARNNTGVDFNNGAFSIVSIYGPVGLFLDGSGNLYFADSLNMIVQEIQSNFIALNDLGTPIRLGEKSVTQVQTVENDGNAPFDLTAINLGANAALDPSLTTCVQSPPLMAVDDDCEIGAVFAPAATLVIPPPAVSEPADGNIDVGKSGDTVNAPLDIELVGIATVIDATTTTLTSSPNPSGFGQSVSFTATVTTGAGTGNLTGTVTFSVDGVNVGTPVILNAAGVAVYATSGLTVGVHKITASYNNDPDHLASTSATLTQTVLEGTMTILVSNQNPSSVGAPVTFTATVTVPSGGGNVPPDGTVVFSDGATILGSITLTPQTGEASFTTATLANGLHSITATYVGDASNQIQGSTSNVVKQDVLVPGSVSLVSNPNPSTYGAPVTFIVAVAPTGAAPATGTVNILDGSQQIGTSTLVGATGQATFTTSALVVGTHSITAAYQGDSNYGPDTSAPVAQVVNQAQTTTTVSAAPNPGIAGGAVTLTAIVKVTAGATTPTGAVTFTSGATTLGSAALGAAGTATLKSTFAVGAYTIVATYSGDANDSGSASAPYSLQVQMATTATAVTASPSPATVDSPISFVAKVTGNGGIPTGSVAFSADGASMGTATLDATGTATLSYAALAAGTHQITASYAGDANDSPSTSTTISLVVTTIPTATALGATSTGGASPQVTLVAAVVGTVGPTPTGTVTFNDGTTVIGSATLDASGIATLNPNLAAGSYTIVAVYSGDTLHSPSTSLPATISGTPAGFNLTVSPSSVSMAAGQNATVTVTVTSVSGFADANIGLGCASLPAAVNCHFSSASVGLAANATQTIQLTIDTNNPLSGGSSAMNAHSGNRGVALAGLFLPAALFFGWIFWLFRKRHRTLFVALSILVLGSAAMLVNGCSGFSQATASPGNYTIQVTATGTNSNVTHYQNVTLNITQ